MLETSVFLLSLAQRRAAVARRCLADIGSGRHHSRPSGPTGITLLVGHRPETFFDASGQAVIPGTIVAPEALSQSRASVIAEIAEIRLREDPSASPHLLLPQYLVVSQAERRSAGGRS